MKKQKGKHIQHFLILNTRRVPNCVVLSRKVCIRYILWYVDLLCKVLRYVLPLFKAASLPNLTSCTFFRCKVTNTTTRKCLLKLLYQSRYYRNEINTKTCIENNNKKLFHHKRDGKHIQIRISKVKLRKESGDSKKRKRLLPSSIDTGVKHFLFFLLPLFFDDNDKAV